jgi:hypothetical protein
MIYHLDLFWFFRKEQNCLPLIVKNEKIFCKNHSLYIPEKTQKVAHKRATFKKYFFKNFVFVNFTQNDHIIFVQFNVDFTHKQKSKQIFTVKIQFLKSL